MGGTSTDISVIVEGRLLETTQGQIAGQDIGTPMLRVRTLGAGGGTIAWIGKDGLLKVGPRSAGSVPGPACYGRGGEEPTVTDANVALGALSGDTVLAGSLRIDAGRAARAIETVAKPLGLDVLQGAAGILRIVNTQMAVDLRLALQEQGQDPRKFALVAFGGAGPLHAAALARSVGIPTVLVPPYPGLNCAIGMLQTSVRHSYLKSEVGVLSRFPTGRMNDLFRELREQALAEASEEGFAHEAVKLTRLLDLRYPHQGYTLAGCLSGRHHGRGQGAAQACLRRGASPGLWPVRPQGGRGDRDLPAAGGDRGPAARIARACARRRTRRARLEGRASALRYR